MGLQDWRRLDYRRAEKNILAARDNISNQIAQSDLELAKINNSLGCLYLDMGKYESAYDFLNSALAAFQPAYDANNIEVRAVMFSIAQYDYYTGNFERARKTAQDIIDNSNTKTDKVVITSISHFIAMIYDSLGKYDSAISMYKDVLSLYDDIAEDKELSKNLADYANDPHLSQDEKEDKTNAVKWIILTYNNMGQVYTHLKKYDSACSALQTGLSISLDNIYIGRENLTASKLYMNLAVADANLGNIKEALDNIDLAMRIQKKLFNYEGSYPGLVEVYNTYATLLMKNNDYANAKNYLKKEIELAKTTFGENHPLTAEAYNTFSIYWYKCGNYEKAASSAEKAITIRKNILGKNHLTTAAVYQNLSDCYNNMGKFEKSITNAQEAVSICEAIYGKDNINTAQAYTTLVWPYANMGKIKNAENRIKLALDICSKQVNTANETVAYIYQTAGYVYMRKRNFTTAEQYLKQAQTLFSSLSKEISVNTAEIYRYLGDICMEKSNYQNASDYYQNAWSIYQQVFQNDDSYESRFVSQIKNLYKNLKPKESYENWLKKWKSESRLTFDSSRTREHVRDYY